LLNANVTMNHLNESAIPQHANHSARDVGPPRVLLVDDDADLCALMSDYLAQHGVAITCAGNGTTGLSRILQTCLDLIILDVMLPCLDGFEVLRQLRRRSDVPVIILTARVAPEDRIQGLEIGADDYLTKPFVPRELLARIRAMLRRRERRELAVQVGALSVDAERRRVAVAGDHLHLTSIEFDILDLLARGAGRVVSRDEISRALHQRESAANDRSLDVHISHVRRKLAHAAGPDIRTVRGVGYLLARP
jgi:two-component system, OmpR family, response regulator CpxR